MRTLITCQPKANARDRSQAGHTLTELMTAMAVFSLAVIGILACHLAGLRYNLMILPKIQNAQYSRQTLSHLVEEIRSANSIQIGMGTRTTFTAAGVTNSQTGNALRIFPGTNLTQFIYYYHDPASATLNKTSLQTTNSLQVANSVTNDLVFSMQDFSGNVLTNNQNNAVVRVLLQMTRTTPITGLRDPYQVEAKVTRRNIL